MRMVILMMLRILHNWLLRWDRLPLNFSSGIGAEWPTFGMINVR